MGRLPQDRHRSPPRDRLCPHVAHAPSLAGRAARRVSCGPSVAAVDSPPVALTIGIVGLPNAGKSTLFNALTKNDVLAANYPFATIEPNVGVVGVPDERLPQLAEVFESAKVLPATVEFVDIAGIVRGASQGEGLGNKFLAHIRESAAICQVTRVFRDEDVTHVDGEVDPANDISHHPDRADLRRPRDRRAGDRAAREGVAQGQGPRRQPRGRRRPPRRRSSPAPRSSRPTSTAPCCASCRC